LKRYTFVDYASQGYSALAGLLILCFHNRTVPCWGWLVAAHVAGLGLVHWLVEGRGVDSLEQGRQAGPELTPRAWRKENFVATFVATFVGLAVSRQSWRQRLRQRLGIGGFGTGSAPNGTASLLARTRDFLRHFYPVLLYLWFFCETGWVNRMFFTEYMDPLAVGWDQAVFGCQPGIVLIQRMPWLALSEPLYAAYFSYYPMIGGVGLALFLRDRRQFFHYISVVSFVFYLCYVVYIFVPIIGPRTFFEPMHGYMMPEEFHRFAPVTAYPEAIQSGPCFRLMSFVYRVFEAPGAAIPSSHVAVALCTVYFSFSYLRRIRYPHLVLALILCFSTVYCRFHYGVDALAGAATAAILVPLGNRLYWKFDRGVG
jgi:membrane-associated phospholipid phosphatase